MAQKKQLRTASLDHEERSDTQLATRCAGTVSMPLTMLGSHKDSHMPYICSEQVPLTTKSSVTMGQPIRSREQMNGSKVLGSSPAMTGSM